MTWLASGDDRGVFFRARRASFAPPPSGPDVRGATSRDRRLDRWREGVALAGVD